MLFRWRMGREMGMIRNSQQEGKGKESKKKNRNKK